MENCLFAAIPFLAAARGKHSFSVTQGLFFFEPEIIMHLKIIRVCLSKQVHPKLLSNIDE